MLAKSFDWSTGQGFIVFTERGRTVAYTRRGEHVLDASLAALEAQLDPRRFVRCHRAHVVQTRFVTGVEQDAVVLGDGRRAPLSRRCRAGLLEALRAGA